MLGKHLSGLKVIRKVKASAKCTKNMPYDTRKQMTDCAHI